MTPRFVLFLAFLAISATSAVAAPARYTLDGDRSSVGFAVAFGPDRITGSMPVEVADLILDFDRAANSTVSVALDARRANASFPFATQALRGPKVLHTRQHPQIAFRSTSVRARGGGAAEIAGEITIRGVTRPITLDAQLFRQQGTDADDLAQLSILLTGSVQRSAFGATGWVDMVGDRVDLRILARVRRVE